MTRIVAPVAFVLLLCACLTPSVKKPKATDSTDESGMIVAHMKKSGVLSTHEDFWMIGPVLANSSHSAVVHVGGCVAFVGKDPEGPQYLIAVFDKEADAAKAAADECFKAANAPDLAVRKGKIVLVAPTYARKVIQAFNEYRPTMP